MATRRRYKSSSPQHYRDGGAVIPPGNIADAPEPEASADVTPPPVAASAPAPGDHDAVRRAHEAMRRAEEYQRQRARAQPQTIEEAIDRLPLSERRKAFLKQHQELLDPENRASIEYFYEQAKRSGIAPDSDEEDAHILRGVHKDMEVRRERLTEKAREAVPAMQSLPTPEPSVDKVAEQLANEAEGYRQMQAAEDATPMSLAMNLPEAAPTTPARKSLPISAPVSRDVPTSSGRRMSETNSVTLTPDEMAIARLSYSWLPPIEAERTYARMKAKRDAMRREGTYPMPERN